MEYLWSFSHKNAVKRALIGTLKCIQYYGHKKMSCSQSTTEGTVCTLQKHKECLIAVVWKNPQ